MKKPLKKPKKEARITFRVDAALFEQAENMARAADLTVSWVARQCLEKWVADAQRKEYRPFPNPDRQPDRELIAA